jgi:uncharacterized membrane protein
MGWNEFAFAFAAFFLTHSIPIRPPLRPWAVARLGHAGFGIAYSALSLAVLAWLIAAAGRAPYVPLWDWAPWQNHVVLAVMLPVCVILSLAIARPNPFSFGGAQNDRFDPASPGIVRLTRHPLLLALGIWSAAHILPNGDLAHVICSAPSPVSRCLAAALSTGGDSERWGRDGTTCAQPYRNAPHRYP